MSITVVGGITFDVGLNISSPAAPFPVPSPDNLRYWFSADVGVFSDEGITPAVNDDPVCTWANQGQAPDFGLQTNLANRPIFKTDGLNGKPYIEANGTNQWFNDLIEGSQPSGFFLLNPYSVFVVADMVNVSNSIRVVFGVKEVTSASAAKALVYFRNPAEIQFAAGKAQLTTVLPNRSGAVGGANVMGAKFITPSQAARGHQTLAMTNYMETTNPNTTASNGMMFLRHGSTPAAFFLGRIYEVLYYNINLPNVDCNTVINYLATKYAIT